MAGCFLFKGDDVKKKVSVLSGGEKARLCLAGLLLSKNQVLLLDEPTNHLDFETVEALASALKTYTGTLFFISHDRTFVNLVATAIIEVKNGKVMKYPGKYEDYVYHLEVQARELYDEEGSDDDAEEEAREEQVNPNASKKEKSKEERRAEKAELTKLRSQINKAEGRVKHLTKEKEDLLKELENNPFHFSRQRNERIKQLTVIIEKEEALWLALQAQLAARRSDQQLVRGSFLRRVTARENSYQLRHAGLGARLLQELHSWFRSCDITTAEVQVAVINRESRAFWRKNGYGDFLERLQRRI